MHCINPLREVIEKLIDESNKQGHQFRTDYKLSIFESKELIGGA